MEGKQTVEVMGIEVSFDPEVLRGAKFAMCIGDLSDGDLPDEEKLVVNARLMRMLFGAERYRLMDGMEAAGIEFGDWLAAFFEAAGAKN